jgi:hypothetical protein
VSIVEAKISMFNFLKRILSYQLPTVVTVLIIICAPFPSFIGLLLGFCSFQLVRNYL